MSFYRPQVTTLTKDLLLIEDALSHSLQERKIRYIFEGVSHLVAAIFIGAAMDIRKMNENGVKKMCRNIFAVQHTLTASITGQSMIFLHQTFYINILLGDLEKRRAGSFLDFDNFWLNLKATREQL